MNEQTRKIVNVDISDDKEPTLYIQRYIYPERTYQVIRKSWDEKTEDPFIPDPAYEEKYWHAHTFLLSEYDPDEEDLLEVFTLIYLDSENPPTDDPNEGNNAEPYLNIVYDPDAHVYRCEPTFIQYEW